MASARSLVCAPDDRPHQKPLTDGAVMARRRSGTPFGARGDRFAGDLLEEIHEREIAFDDMRVGVDHGMVELGANAAPRKALETGHVPDLPRAICADASTPGSGRHPLRIQPERRRAPGS